MTSELLEKIGLTKGEIKVYTALIKCGSTTVGALIKESGMHRSAVYFCLDSLIKKGLVGYVVKNDRKYFEANRPESLFDYLEARKKEIENQEKEMKTYIPALFARKQLHSDKKAQEAKIYEGWKGVLNAYFDILEPMKAGEEAYAFSPTEGYGGANPERVRRLITKVRLERARKKVRLKMLMSENLKRTLGKDQEGTPYTEVRYTSEDTMNPAVVHIYGNSVLTVLWSETPVAFLIRSEGVAESYRNYFRLLWENGRSGINRKLS